MSEPAIRLVLSDVDGTLVTPEKILTEGAIEAVQHLATRGILFAIASSRPPRGLEMLFAPLGLTTPVAAFNGGLIVDRHLATLRELTIRADLATEIIEILSSLGLSTWVYQGTDWFVLDFDGPHVAHEAEVCQFVPSRLDSFASVRGDVVKVVGVSDDPEAIAAATTILDARFASEVSSTSSQTYYVDVTHRDANKGGVVDYLARALARSYVGGNVAARSHKGL